MKLATALAALLTLGATCQGQLPGSVVCLGNSYCIEAAPEIERQFGCGDIVHEYAAGRVITDNPPVFTSTGTMFQLLERYRYVLGHLEGPVTVWLAAGYGDEVLPRLGFTPQDVAANATELVYELLAIRDDIHVTLMEGAPGTCDATYFDLLAIDDPRFSLPDLSRLDHAFGIWPELYYRADDDCHPSALGARVRVAEAIRVTPELADLRCW